MLVGCAEIFGLRSETITNDIKALTNRLSPQVFIPVDTSDVL